MQATTTALAVTLTLPLLLALSGCGKDGSGGEAKSKTETKEVSTLFTGDKVTIPPAYGDLKLGMTLDEAKQALPALDGDHFGSDVYRMAFFTYPEDGKIHSLHFFLDKDKAKAMLEAQWGKPEQGDEFGKTIDWWFNPEAGLRAALKPSTDNMNCEFTQYSSLIAFLGEGAGLAFEKPGPLLGSSAADVEAKYAGRTVKEDDGINLQFPPSKWDTMYLPVRLSWSEAGTVESYRFNLAYEAHPAAKGEIKAFLDTKWGEPREEDGFHKTFVYSDDPRIAVEEDTTFEHWSVTVEPKRADPPADG